MQPPVPVPTSTSPDKAAFLQPFERFYDALNDSHQLKTWLAEQLSKTNALMASLKDEKDRWEEALDRAVDKKLGLFRAEMEVLKRRVDELEQVPSRARPEFQRRLSSPATTHRLSTSDSTASVPFPARQASDDHERTSRNTNHLRGNGTV